MDKQEKIDELQDKLRESEKKSTDEKLQLIYEQTLRTNGRVTKLENETELVRIIWKNKLLLILILLGLSAGTLPDLIPLIMGLWV